MFLRKYDEIVKYLILLCELENCFFSCYIIYVEYENYNYKYYLFRKDKYCFIGFG